MPPFHLISWNVAGWAKTHAEITRTFPAVTPDLPASSAATAATGVASSAAAAASSLPHFKDCTSATISPTCLAWLHALSVDVLCVQEHKLTCRQLQNGKLSRLANIPGWDTYWSCNDGNGEQRAGLNGVATFSKKASPFRVIRADAAPLRGPSLDNEGRVLLTDHGTFIVFNVYAPNLSGGKRYGYRLRFLAALSNAMERERTASSKPVILLGDLNLKARALMDRHWSNCYVNVDRLASLGSSSPPDSALEKASVAAKAVALRDVPTGRGVRLSSLLTSRRLLHLLQQLHHCWPSIQNCLRSRRVEPYQTRNNATGQTFCRWRTKTVPTQLSLDVASSLPSLSSTSTSSKEVQLGSAEHSEASAWCSFEIDGIGVDRDGNNCLWGPESSSCELTLLSPGMMNIKDLGMCCGKLVRGWTISPELQRELVMSGLGADVPCAEGSVATSSTPSGRSTSGDHTFTSSTEWLASVMRGAHSMVDSFAELHPLARERFTVWNQYQNSRQYNLGSRLDYIFVDAELWRECEPIAGELDVGLLMKRHSTTSANTRFDDATNSTGGSNETISPRVSNHRKSALNACTMRGRWQPAPTSGSGLPDGKPEEYLHHTRMASHCGIVYTPPKWSDHVGVSMACRAMPALDEITRDTMSGAISSSQKKATRRCQPQKSQRSIASFFGKRGSAISNQGLGSGKGTALTRNKSSSKCHSSVEPTDASSYGAEPPRKKKRIKGYAAGFHKLFGMKPE